MSVYPYVQGSARLRARPRNGRLARAAVAAHVPNLPNRWLAHLFALVAISLAAVPGLLGFSDSSVDPVLHASVSGASSPSSIHSAPQAGSAVPTPVPTLAPTPEPELPAWVKNHLATTLWSGPDQHATPLSQLDQWVSLRTLGSAAHGRLLVEEPGDGFSRFPSRGWVDATAVGPADAPAVQWHLGLHADHPSAPAWNGEAWPQGITAEFAVVIDGSSGQILYGKNAHGQVAPASLTKIATAIVALEHASLSDVVPINVDGSAMPESTVMGLSPGQRLSMKTLLYGLMLPSGNDAALAIAEYVGGSEAGFADQMNALVERLELEDTRFVNPHGLDARGHFSSPYDMAMLARYGMRIPAFAEMAGARYYEAEGYQLWNLNKLLGSMEGADGVKPGYTDLAGRAVVGSASRDGHRVFVALMRSPDLWGDTIGLLEYAFRSFEWTE